MPLDSAHRPKWQTLGPLFAGIVGACLAACGLGWARPAEDTTAALANELKAIVLRQSEAWNRGDIDAFMQAYWKSEELTFSSGGRTQTGWQATRDGYHARYPDRETMGQLTFSELRVRRLDEQAALMLGTWRLDRQEPVGGNFSLVWQKIEGVWVIVHDHTSVLASER